ncbi:MAG: NADH-quinone oxidoreductase subunit J [Acidimicrobiia bacterium]|nr:NADH-quinone oxidoreductase subunit J [Acidimicrobiia bacterium]
MGEVVVFSIFAAVALVGGVVMVTSPNPVYSAIGLLAAMFSVAVMYVLLDAHFVAAVQVIIYAGAVMTLFLFVIMLIGVDTTDAYGDRPAGQRAMIAVVGVGLFAAIVLAARSAWITGSDAFGHPDMNGTIETVADELFGTWTIVFLSTVMLLTIAALGTIALAYFDPGSGADDEGATL